MALQKKAGSYHCRMFFGVVDNWAGASLGAKKENWPKAEEMEHLAISFDRFLHSVRSSSRVQGFITLLSASKTWEKL